MEAASNPFVARMDVWQQTQEMAHRLPDPPPSHKYVHNADFVIKPRFASTKVEVRNQDTVLAGVTLMNEGLNPVLLNMADPKTPGGVVQMGSGAQEESLCRVSNYHRTLVPSLYPLAPLEGVYSSQVTVFRTPESDCWQPMRHPYWTSFIAVPGLYMPTLEDGALKDVDRNVLRAKVELILQMASVNGHDSVVLGALGCGAFKCPPLDVARTFRECLERYDGVFNKVVFAVMSTDDDSYIVRRHDGEDSNFATFLSVLGAG